MNEQEQLAKSRRIYLKFLIIALFAFALLHSINPFFFRFFFWISFGMGAMALYYHITLKIAERGSQTQFRPQGQRAGWTTTKQSESSATATPPQIKKVAVIVGIVVFSFFFLLMIIGFVAGEDESTQTEISDTFAYGEARVQYENEDYRGAIKTLWPEITSNSADNQTILLMADSYYAMQSLDSAYVWYSEAYSRGERYAFLSHVMGYILDEKGDTQEAIKFYKEAVEMDSTKVDVYSRLAELEPQNRDLYLKLKQRNGTSQ